MGDPKFPRRKFATPFHPWKADRITEENALQHKYGLKNKKEVWRVKSHLRSYRNQARELLAKNRTGDAQAGKETQQLLGKLARLGLLQEGATLDDVLALNIDQVLGRRLQTLVYLRGFTGSINQARQFIAHGHVAINGNRVNVPGYYVKRGEEEVIAITEGRPVADEGHPARPKRVEGAPAPRLKEYKPRTVEMGRGRGGPPGRGGPGGRGPPRGGGGFGRGPPGGGYGRGGPGGPPPAPAGGTDVAPPPGSVPETPRGEEAHKKKKPNEPRIQGGGAF